MLTGDLANELGLSVNALHLAARSIEVEKRCGRLWWTPETIELLRQELERLAEARKRKTMYPRTAEVASRLGVREADLRCLIHQHGLPVEKDKAGKVYTWTEQAIASARALLEELAARPPLPPAPPPSGLTSKEVATRLRMATGSFTAFARASQKRGVVLQPIPYKGALYWREEDVPVLEQALAEHRAKPDLRQTREVRTQKGRLARLREHAWAIGDGAEGMAMPQKAAVQTHVQGILALCGEMEAALTLSLTFISTLPVVGWTLRHPISVWVRPVAAGFEAVPVDFDLRTVGTTKQGAIELLRYALCRRYLELAEDPAQDAPTWTALQQLLVPPDKVNPRQS